MSSSTDYTPKTSPRAISAAQARYDLTRARQRIETLIKTLDAERERTAHWRARALVAERSLERVSAIVAGSG